MKAITKFGMRKQRIKAAEETAELTQALLKDELGEPHNVEEEIADVEIMLAQMRLIYNQDTINGYIDAKLERLKRRLNKI
jgi:NTP pyrophosphatase (non-canonical NTP hydrolase)